LKLKDFYFHLPGELIARFPAERRDESRLMVVERKTGSIRHHRFKDIEEFILPEDFLVVNNSKVIPVRLFGEINGKKVDLLIVRIMGEKEVEALTLPARKFKKGQRVVLGENLWADVFETGGKTPPGHVPGQRFRIVRIVFTPLAPIDPVRFPGGLPDHLLQGDPPRNEAIDR